MSAVQLSLGPVPSALALAWLDNSRSLLRAVRVNRSKLPIWSHDDTLELCDALLGLWTAHANAAPVFEWSMATEPDVVVQVARQWLEIGALTDDDLAAIGATWAPSSTRPFADALVVGVSSALGQCGTAGEELLDRLATRRT